MAEHISSTFGEAPHSHHVHLKCVCSSILKCHEKFVSHVTVDKVSSLSAKFFLLIERLPALLGFRCHIFGGSKFYLFG